MNGRNDRRMVIRDDEPVWGGYPLGLMSDMDRIMDRMFRDFGLMNLGPLSLEARRPEAYIRGPGFMPMDLTDGGSEFTLKMEMPGLRKENIEISLDGQVLTIGAKEEERKEEEGRNFLLRERRAFNCKRSIKLPEEVVSDEVKARMEDGVLQLTLPKRSPPEAEKPKVIEVE